MIEKIDKELELWKHYYESNDNMILENILVDVLASFTKEEAQEKIDRALEVLKNLEKPLLAQEAISSIKSDIESLEGVKEEARVAYRTLSWVKEELVNNDRFVTPDELLTLAKNEKTKKEDE